MKTRDPLLQAVGRQIADADGLDDPRWDALARGALSSSEAADLEAKVERGEALPQAYEAFRPFDEAERDAIADEVLAALAAPVTMGPQAAPNPAPPSSAPPRSTGPEGSPPRERGAASDAPAGAQDAKVIPLGPRRASKGRWVGLLASLAAAAALVVALRSGPSPVPGYGALIEGGHSVVRSSPAASAQPRIVKLGTEERLRVMLRPDTEVDGALEARAFFAGPAGLRPIEARVEQAPHGTLVIPSIDARALGGAAGEGELIFVVGRPGKMPAEAEVAKIVAAGGTAGAAFQIVRVRVAVGDAP